MKIHIVLWLLCLISTSIRAQQYSVSSPDNQLDLVFIVEDGKPYYSVKYNSKVMLENSPLGIVTTAGDFYNDLIIETINRDIISKSYSNNKIKQQQVVYKANTLKVTLTNTEKNPIEIEFAVSNNNVGFRYNLLPYGELANCIVKKEHTGFNFAETTTTFLSPQATPGIGWKGTKPSYEEEYVPDEPIGSPSKYGLGYTFPSLFHVGEHGWVLVSETGVDGKYCGSRLGEGTKEGVYSIAYPELAENNNIGSANPIIALPGSTPWRTITVSNTLKPIVETTIPFDLVEPLYEPTQEYKFGRSTWSWIMWQDWSMNYNDQLTYIDFAADMGYEYILMDALWDKNVGYEKMAELIEYAHSKNVDVFLWYNSNGFWNNAPQGPKHKMNNAIARKKEMKWLQEMGVKGLKIDFFGGDKQETMQLYEAILSDANEYGLMIIFHGCTLPRGWEIMYPNYVGSEAVLASENLIFTQHANEMEAYNACLHPFIRNAAGSMEFGPVLLNKRHNRTNDGGTTRRTTDVFQLATAVLFQNPVQMFALAPNNLTDVPAFEINFMKNVPTTWDETIYIDGYPGKYVVLARRHNKQWYIVGVNASKELISLDVELPMLAGKTAHYYGDDSNLAAFEKETSIDNSGKYNLKIQANGGVILINKL